MHFVNIKFPTGFLNKSISVFLFIFFFCHISYCEDQYEQVASANIRQPDFSWSNGISLFDSGYISKSLHLLDSLTKDNNSDYAATALFVKKAFRLLGYGSKKDINKTDSFEIDRYFLDTLSYSSFKCAVVSKSIGGKCLLPSFSYNIRFPVIKPYLLSFNGLSQIDIPHLSMKRKVIVTALSDDLLDQIDTKDDSITCSIFIDLNVSGLTLHDYINDYINGVFDSITIKSDLKKYNALSLRGYNRKYWSIEKGKFTAIIAFDRLIPDRKSVRGRETISPMPVRYTVVVESAGSVRELAEAKLQTLLKTL